MKIRRELKYATFEYDDEDKTILIETRSDATPDKNYDVEGHIETDEEYAKRVAELDPPLNGRIHLNKTYAFALLRFVVRISQRNWFRKAKK
jgi:hypothetical protein